MWEDLDSYSISSSVRQLAQDCRSIHINLLISNQYHDMMRLIQEIFIRKYNNTEKRFTEMFYFPDKHLGF